MKISKMLTATLLTLGLSTQIMAGSALSQKLIESAKKDVKSISPKALKKMLDNEENVYMLDIREQYMVVEGSIDGMENVAIGRGVLEFDIEDKIKDKKAFIVVYCRSGKGAVLATKTMKEDLHYENVQYLEGGLDGWLEAGYSIFNHFGELQLVQ